MTIVAIALAALMTVEPEGAAAQREAPSDAEATPAVEVNAQALGPDVGPPIAQEVAVVIHRLAIKLGVDPATVTIRIYWRDPDAFEYGVIANLAGAGAEERDVSNEQICQCTQDKIVGMAIGAVRTAAQEAERERQFAADAARRKRAREEAARKQAVPQDSPKRAQLTGLGWGGIGLLAAGTAGVAAGAGLTAVGTRRLPEDMSQLRDFRPAGYSLLAVGGGVLIAGAVMLALDLKAQRGRSAALAPIPGGVALFGRF